MSATTQNDWRGDSTAEPECSTSDAATQGDVEAEHDAAIQASDKEALQKVQVALKTKIQELEAAEAEDKEIAKAAKKAIREVQKVMSSKEHSVAQKLEIFQEKLFERVNAHSEREKAAAQSQKKLERVTAERVALTEEVRRLTGVNAKLQDLCRTLQAQNKTVVREAHEKAAAEAQQRQELTERMETAMQNISTRLEEHSIESQKCLDENMELRGKLEQMGQFCDEMETNHQEQLARRDKQIAFLKERLEEQSQLLEHYSETEHVLQEKCGAAEAARDGYATQLEDAKKRINGFCDSFEKSNTAFKQLQTQVDMSHKIQKKMQQESELLKKRSDLVQQKCERLSAENEMLTEQVDGMRGKLEQSALNTDHEKLRQQNLTLERLCRALQSQLKELRRGQANGGAPSPQSQPSTSVGSHPILESPREE